VAKISVVINTLNEEENLARALSSVEKIADEVVVVDMKSTDRTRTIAREYEAKVYSHERTGYVEPARNFAIDKASNDWILVLDADEEVPASLAAKLVETAKKPDADFYRLPRKNINFGRWIKNSHWWPDYNIRFFKKGSVSWNEVIHSVPMTVGAGADFPEEEKYALVHYNYQTVSKYVSRMNRYTDIQAALLREKEYKFAWQDVIRKPLGEFLSRYFAGEGYKDGLHGLALALLQAVSELILYLKMWQQDRFKPQAISLSEFSQEVKRGEKQLRWWEVEAFTKTEGFFASFPKRIYRKFFNR
jgi:(heptosyl)LPS beta-1,4-glucosyltransferase